MRIDYNIHLDYSDVLLHPKRSTLSSRRDVDILRKFKFRNSGKELSYVPIMASNMDGVGTFSMARVLQEYKMLTVIRKHYNLDDWKQAAGTGLKFKYVYGLYESQHSNLYVSSGCACWGPKMRLGSVNEIIQFNICKL